MATLDLNPNSNPQAQRAGVIVRAHNQQADSIRNDGRLSPDGKKALLARNYVQSKQKLADLQAQQTDAVTKRQAQLQRQLFGTATDPATLASYRDAQGRADALATPRAAHTALDRAAVTGDGLMARAVALRAADQGWGDVLNHYADNIPGAGEALDELNQIAAGNSAPARLASSMMYSLTVPDELKSCSTAQIQQLAAQAPDVTAQFGAPIGGNAPGSGASFPMLSETFPMRGTGPAA